MQPPETATVFHSKVIEAAMCVVDPEFTIEPEAAQCLAEALSHQYTLLMAQYDVSTKVAR